MKHNNNNDNNGVGQHLGGLPWLAQGRGWEGGMGLSISRDPLRGAGPEVGTGNKGRVECGRE